MLNYDYFTLLCVGTIVIYSWWFCFNCFTFYNDSPERIFWVWGTLRICWFHVNVSLCLLVWIMIIFIIWA